MVTMARNTSPTSSQNGRNNPAASMAATGNRNDKLTSVGKKGQKPLTTEVNDKKSANFSKQTKFKCSNQKDPAMVLPRKEDAKKGKVEPSSKPKSIFVNRGNSQQDHHMDLLGRIPVQKCIGNTLHVVW